jgi:thioredoxin-like negative regulator of GroEL
MEALLFTLSGCKPCQAMKLFIDKLPIKVKVIDAEVEQKLAEDYGITQVPVFVLEKKGAEVARLVGGKNKDTVEKFLVEHGA